MKRKLLGLMMAAVMVFGSAGAVLADDADTQGETYYFQKVYQLTGGNTDTAKSPAEEFTFESKDAEAQAGKANLYAVSGTSYNDTNTPDVITELESLPGENSGEIPESVKAISIGSVSYAAGDAKDIGNFKNVAITVPKASNYKSVGYYYYKFTEKAGNTAGVTYSGDINVVRVAVVNENEQLKIGDVRLFNENATAKKDNVINSYSSGRLKVVKSVTGNMGDQNKEFEVTITFNAGDKKIKAPINIATNHAELNNPTVLNPTEGGSSELQISIKVKNGTSVEFSNLPAGVTYQVIETQAAGYEKPVYRLNGTDVTDPNGAGVSGTVTGGAEPNITIVNRKDTQIDTGIFTTSNLPYALVLAGVAVAAVWFFAGKKRRTEEK